jgi:tripartite-type tricarboxylate transporter receptor subunit TctC
MAVGSFVRWARFLPLCAAAFGALAQDAFPQKPVTLLVSYPAGGSVDVTARILQAPLSRELGQQVVIDNKGGAGGTIATAAVAKARPDGYTLLITLSSHTINPWIYDKLPFDTRKDFAPVSLVASTPQVLVANPSFPVNTLAELIAYAKRPGGTPIPYGSAGIGSPSHIAGELMRMQSGGQFTHVPYRGGGPATIAVVGGEIPLLWVSLPSIAQQVKAGKLKALAVSTSERAPTMPDVPTVAEAIPGFRVDAWNAIFAPAGTPPAVMKKLQTALMTVMRQPAVKQALLDQGAIAVGSSGEDLDKVVETELQLWQSVTKAANIKAE